MTLRHKAIEMLPEEILKSLLLHGQERGYLTHGEVLDLSGKDDLNSEMLAEVALILGELGIELCEDAPSQVEQLVPAAVAEEVVDAAVSAWTQNAGDRDRCIDPIRMYFRDMGTTALLTREQEIDIARRMEACYTQMVTLLAECPGFSGLLLSSWHGADKPQDVVAGLADVIDSLMPSAGNEMVEGDEAAVSAEQVAQIAAKVGTLAELHEQY